MPDSDETAIRQLVSTWMNASIAGDTERVLSLMSDDAVFLIAGQPPMRKSDFAVAQQGLREVELQCDYDIQEIRVFGNWAYCWNHIRVTATPRNGAAPVKRAGHALSVLNKADGRWVLVRDANLLTVQT